MLLLPLILWWAHAPLRAAQGRLRIFTAALVILALAITSGSIKSCVAEDRSDRQWTKDRHLLTVQQREDPTVLREGSFIPPTAGQIVMLGRRWTFVPAAHEGEAPRDLTQQNGMTRRSVVAFSSTRLQTLESPRPVRLGTKTPGWGYQRSSSPAINTSAFAKPKATTLATTARPQTAADLPQMLLTENLMLERIVEAIRADAADNRWSISGEVTEYFGENRLLIRTAQRASSD